MTNNLAPLYLTSICPPTIASTSKYVTRYSQSIMVLRYKTSLFKNDFLPSTIRHWNDLDIDVRNSNSLNIFKSKLKLHFRFSSPLIIYTLGTVKHIFTTLDFDLVCHHWLLISFLIAHLTRLIVPVEPEKPLIIFYLNAPIMLYTGLSYWSPYATL